MITRAAAAGRGPAESLVAAGAADKGDYSTYFAGLISTVPFTSATFGSLLGSSPYNLVAVGRRSRSSRSHRSQPLLGTAAVVLPRRLSAPPRPD